MPPSLAPKLDFQGWFGSYRVGYLLGNPYKKGTLLNITFKKINALKNVFFCNVSSKLLSYRTHMQPDVCEH